MAAIADWFKANWKETRKPRVAYLTADNAMGRSIEIPEMKAYLEKTGYEFVGTQYVPLVPTSPPTTQLTWLKQKGVDLALGVMINPGSQPTVKEMVRLGMGPNQPYKMTFGVPAPGHSAVFAEAMGELGDGYVCAGSFRPMDDLATPGVKFCSDLQDKYRSGKRIGIGWRGQQPQFTPCQYVCPGVWTGPGFLEGPGPGTHSLQGYGLQRLRFTVSHGSPVRGQPDQDLGGAAVLTRSRRTIRFPEITRQGAGR